MTKHPLRLDDYLKHINQAIDRIESYIKDCDQLAFITNTMIQDRLFETLKLLEKHQEILNVYFLSL